MARNITEVRLLSVPLENDYRHTLWFASKAAQETYFKNHVKHYTGNDFSYQRKDNVIRYPIAFDSVFDCNYVMYKNAAYGDRWFYAFITNMEYVNDERTDITIETDVMQTYMFDYTIKPSFVEREHTANDTVGDNTIPENLQLGEYVCNRHTRSEYVGSDFYIIVAVSDIPDSWPILDVDMRPGLYNGIYSGLMYFAFEHSSDGKTALNQLIDYYDNNGKGDAIQSMFLAPKKLVNTEKFMEIFATVARTTTPDVYYINHGGSGNVDTNFEISTNELNGYSNIRNKKLLTYPYRYLIASNNCGASVIYHYEEFRKTDKTVCDPMFVIEGCLTPGCSIRMVPVNYKGTLRNDDEGINMGKFPVLNWTSDVYTNWLTQNAVNIGVSLATDAIGVVTGGATARMNSAWLGASMPIGMTSTQYDQYVAAGHMNGMLGNLSSIGSTLGEIYKASLIPAQSKGNINSGDIITASGQNDIHFYDMSIKAEYAKIIDEYFDMFGYKTSRVKIPNKNHRQNYWFTKTIGINIDGAIPAKDMQIIKNCYDNGITFWKNAANIGDYSVSNEISI